jgi:hypothetical protein
VGRRAGRREVGNLERLYYKRAWTDPPQVILYSMQDNYLLAMPILRPCKNMFAVSGQGWPTLRPQWVATGRHLAGAHFLQGIRSAHVDLAHAVAERSNDCFGSWLCKNADRSLGGAILCLARRLTPEISRYIELNLYR